ncbi:hypothetical protein BpHYR1_046528 [Brachionus plicatilis]|uniref:Uncharacterized protein n=1 Tax=Brachionus plicatilis TaxID=10195 RepID=A0A3M7PQJ4_BRAPC|nr:hypothetical protein BpHYR1_046528 [Brachionus plicatilis]
MYDHDDKLFELIINFKTPFNGQILHLIKFILTNLYLFILVLNTNTFEIEKSNKLYKKLLNTLNIKIYSNNGLGFFLVSGMQGGATIKDASVVKVC